MTSIPRHQKQHIKNLNLLPDIWYMELDFYLLVHRRPVRRGIYTLSILDKWCLARIRDVRNIYHSHNTLLVHYK